MAKNGIEKALGTNKRLGAKKNHSGFLYVKLLPLDTGGARTLF